MVEKFINRPVLSTVFSIIIFLMGLLGLASLPVTQFPDIAPPMVQVSTMYMGASADVVLKSVNAPLEEQINGVENMTYISSNASNDGQSSIKVYFSLGTNADLAAVNVQNRVAMATSKLPAAVVQYGITTEKSQSSMLLMISLYSENPAYDETFLENFLRIHIYPKLQRVKGVGRVSIFGSHDYSMRVWLQPERLASYGLVPRDVIAAIQEQNIEAAPGKFGENSEQTFTYTIKYKGKFIDEHQYGDIVVKALSDGRILRLRDVATIKLGAFNYAITAECDGFPSSAAAVYQMAGTNARQIVTDIKKVLKESSETFPKGVKYVIPFDTNKFLEASIDQVIDTFIEAFILVFIVVFLFLQDFKSTLIPGIASLVAIVGTFFFLLIMGFTLNILTLFALVLAIGMVVDDAIVVVEAVHAKMNEGERDVKKATISAMNEITGAIISITLVMSAVFLPVTFMSGPTGVFYNQFALTLAIAIVISAVNALTLSPVLCTLFIKPSKEDEKKSMLKRFYAAFNVGFDKMTDKYVRSVGFLIRRRWIALLSLALFGGATYWFLSTTPTGFIPTEDQGVLFVDVSLPPGAARERTDAVLKEVAAIVDSMDVVEHNLIISGTSIIAGANGPSYGLAVISLRDWDKRPDVHINDVLGELYAKTAHFTSARVSFFLPPTVPGFSVSDGFEVQLQDRSGDDITRFYEVATKFVNDLSQQDEIKFATTSFNVKFPQYEFEVNADKCKLMGVNVSDVFEVLQVYYGSAQASDFNRFSKYYRVMVQSAPESRNNIESLSKIMVRGIHGDMVPVTTFVKFKLVSGPESLNRFNLFNSATINGAAQEGFSSGDAIEALQRVASTSLPSGYGYEYSGLTREETASGGQSAFIFLLCFIFVYLILSAQYESYILPWAVMLSLIIGVFGVYLFVWMTGLDNNIYVQVALIMLIGLLAKNGILIVEFALQKRAQGMSLAEAAKEGARARLRPILMTSFAFIFGMVPLVAASGAGAAGNFSIGVAAAGGMLVGTVFGVFVIPAMFVVFRSIDEKISGSKKINE